ncbi:MAG: tRNA (adenosine(37)-N6)-threonylcarbamoyltransferase complex ATPase subunit type 1 TsaE [Bacteroidetes bacterium MED-G21]|nr:MAG: tRNA (adenosine(37)-N6)-threonylcarbamoyltransferase complex ATPase subunit type 1 TsaE [Bacteroidetes bacterium MED-G21]|tara:strand:+ start:86 stop:508 length:423 start_codon:yes stop_codon:yes gene_type:complete
MRVIINSIEELPDLAAKITKAYSNKVIAFYGEMSAGKTTFIKYLCQELGVDPSLVNSPTYSMVNEYETRGDQLIFHFDFYRIKDENEAYDMGYENYFYSNHYCFIEWPEKITNLLPEKLLRIHIESEANMRIFTIEEIKS